MSHVDLAASFRSRFDDVAARLERHAGSSPPGGLTEPDQPSGEQWEWGQVWAHLAEFPDYWLDQIARALVAPDAGPVPFGRTKTDPDRVGAIERDRGMPIADLMARLREELDRLGATIDGLTDQDWSRRFLHPTLGEMDLSRVVEEFLVGHLEQHADQLDGLAGHEGA